MIEKRIEICIGTDRARNIRARLSLLTFESGRLVSEHYHSINLAPGDDLATRRAENERHLADPNGGIPGAPWPKIPDAEWAHVEQHVAIDHTPEIVAACKAKQSEEATRQEAQRIAAEQQAASRAAQEQERFRAAVADEVASLMSQKSSRMPSS